MQWKWCVYQPTMWGLAVLELLLAHRQLSGDVMTTFYLVRHGKRADAVGDAALSPYGRAQAWATARSLQHRPITHIYASPLRRARETADIIAARHAFPVIEEARLRERVNWGDLPGQSFAEFVAMWERTTRDRSYLPPVGDSAAQAGERLAAFVRDRTRLHPQGEIIAVTHGGLITDFLVSVFAEETLNRWHAAFIAQQSSLIAECSITVVEYDGEVYNLTMFADIAHLGLSDAQE